MTKMKKLITPLNCWYQKEFNLYYCYISTIIVYAFLTKCIIFTDCKEIDFSYQGHYLKEIAANNNQQCQEFCNLEPGCLFWTWSEMNCQLKPSGALQNRTQKQGAVSGTANCPGK